MAPFNSTEESIDIFISYSHADNTEIIPDTDQGWVSDLHQRLEERLIQVRGSKCDIFRDPRISGVNTTLDNDLKCKVECSTYLLVVVTPSYVKSKYCRDERNAFINKFGGTEEGSKKIIRVDKTPVDPPPLPGELEDKFAYRFFRMDQAKNRPVELHPYRDKASVIDYIELINDLAYDIRKELDKKEEPINEARENTIYLAESPGMEEFRKQIKRELKQHKINILPKRQVSYVPEKAKVRIREDLENSILSVHLIGTEYVPLKKGSDPSLEEIQFEEASSICKEENFNTLVWTGDNIESNDEKQLELLERVEGNEYVNDVICGSIEMFKTEINRIFALIKNQPKIDAVKNKTTYIYLYSSRESLQATNLARSTNHIDNLKKHLKELGYSVLQPRYSDDPEKTIRYHKSLLGRSEGLICYFCASDPDWHAEIEIELLDDPDLGRSNPLKSRCIYAEHDQIFNQIHGLVGLKAEANFDSKVLREFLSRLEMT